MRKQTGAKLSSKRRAEPLPFGVALGHRLRQVRERNDATAAEVAAMARRCGLGWDRSTLARIELGQRQVTAAELLVMPVLYGVPLRDLLPTEAVRFSDRVTATPKGLQEVLVEETPGGREWHIEGLVDEVLDALERIKPGLAAIEARLPGADVLTIAAAVEHFRDETTGKVAARLGATSEEVAVAAEMLWRRGIAAERDARVDDMGPAANTRARQARRGHVTRVLLAELAPAVIQVRTGERTGPPLTITTRHEQMEGSTDGQR